MPLVYKVVHTTKVDSDCLHLQYNAECTTMEVPYCFAFGMQRGMYEMMLYYDVPLGIQRQYTKW